MQRSDGTLWINLFAHGRTVYELKRDAVSVEAAMLAAPEADAVWTLSKAVLEGELDTSDEHRLAGIASKRAGTTVASVKATLKAAKKDRADKRAEADSLRRKAERTDTRPQIAAPSPDAERGPVLESLDAVLSACTDAVSPMCDADGWPVSLRNRHPQECACSQAPDRTRREKVKKAGSKPLNFRPLCDMIGLDLP